LQTQTGTLNALTATGGIFINNGAASPAALNIGNGGGGLKVTGASGDIVLTNNGTINSLNSGDFVDGPGNVTLKAFGYNSDINLGGQAANVSVVGSGAGLVDLEAGQDINLGNSAGFGVVRSAGGSIKLVAERNINLDANGYVQVTGGSGSITAIAGGAITLTTSPGNIANAPFFQTNGGAITLTCGFADQLTLTSTGTNAIASNGGNITLTADGMSISKGVNAGTGNMLIQQASAGEIIGLGTASGVLTLSTAALNFVTAKTLTIGNATAGEILLSGTVAPATVTNLTFNTGSNFISTASTISIGAGILTIGFDEAGHGATADLSGGAITAGTVVVNGGVGNDTFITGAGAETLNGGGGVDTAQFSGTMAQYAINTAGGVTTVIKGGVTDTLTGISFLHFSDQTIAVSPSSTPGTTTADLFLRESQGTGTGAVDVFNIANNAIVSGDALGSIGLNWQTFAIGSFAGNPNEADLILQDSNTGNLELFDVRGSQITADGVFGALNGWQNFGVGAFAGNPNESDIIIHNTSSGALFFLDVQHNQIVNSGSAGGIGAEWQTLGTGDFSSVAGETDIMMRDTNTGAVDFLDFQHNQITALGGAGGIGMEWQALGAGDFSGNTNETDLLMRDTTNGQIDVFNVQNNQIVSAVNLGTIGTSWQSLGIGDFSGVAGEIDLVMRDTSTGHIMAFDIQHDQFFGPGHLMGTVGVDWQNLGVGTPIVPGSPLM